MHYIEKLQAALVKVGAIYLQYRFGSTTNNGLKYEWEAGKYLRRDKYFNDDDEDNDDNDDDDDDDNGNNGSRIKFFCRSAIIDETYILMLYLKF